MEWMKRELHHIDLGLSDDDVLHMYELMLTARKVDDRMFALNRQGRVPFVVGSSGHEAVQVASILALDPQRDWVLPYYRDMGVALGWGILGLIVLGVLGLFFLAPQTTVSILPGASHLYSALG